MGCVSIDFILMCIMMIICIMHVVIDKPFNIARNDIIMSFYANCDCFNSIFTGIISLLQ